MRASRMFALSLFVFGAMNVACGGSNVDPGGDAYDSLFQAPNGAATPDRLEGLWGGSVDEGDMRFDVRVQVEDAQTTVAARCNWTDGLELSVGASAASRITQKPSGDLSCFPLTPGGDAPYECGDVEFLASQSDRQQSGDRWCEIDLSPQSYDWTMSGVQLQFTLQGQQIELVKISD